MQTVNTVLVPLEEGVRSADHHETCRGLPPCPYSVTGLAIEYIEDSYLLSGVMVLSRPSV